MTLNEELSSAYPGYEPADDAQNASRLAMGKRAAAVRKTRRIRRSITAAALTGLIGAGLFGLGPRALAVYRLHQIEGVVSDAQTAQMDSYHIRPDGSQVLSVRCFYDHGKWRIEYGGSARIWRDGKSYVLDSHLKKVTVQSSPDGPFIFNPSGFNARAMIADIARWNWRESIEIGEGSFEGVPVTRVTITHADGAERQIVLADRTTSMPVASWTESKTGAGWRLTGLERARFNVPLDPELFSTHFAPSVTVVDLDRMRPEFKAKIETPIATIPWKKRMIAIRTVDVNPNGDIFVLYTDGETQAERQMESDEMVSQFRKGLHTFSPIFRSPHPAIEVASSLGTDYSRVENLQPYAAGPSERFRSGIVLRDGEVLQGAWFIPTHSSPWHPQTVTVKFDGDEVKTYRRQFPTASTPLLPDWAPLMALAPTGEEDVLREELGARRPTHDPDVDKHMR